MTTGSTRAETTSGAAEPPTVIFLHLGKTAGWTLTRILNRNVTPSVRIGNPANTPHGFLSEEPIRAFASWPQERRARPRLIAAHMVYGLHEHVPRPSVYITLLRKPIARVISGYYRVLETPTHRLHDAVAASGMSLEDYVAGGVAMEVDNSQARAIAGDVSTPYGECGPEMLETAKRHIRERFPVVGLTERFDEMLLVMRAVFGWSRLHYVRANVTRRKPERPQISPRALELIEEHNRLDLELYEFVVRRFDEAVEAVPDMGREIERFRRENALYAPWGHLTYTYPRRLRAKLLPGRYGGAVGA